LAHGVHPQRNRYVEVTGSKPKKTQVQVRLLDEDGHVFYRTSGAPDVPLGVK
jgi:hypothetical protein